MGSKKNPVLAGLNRLSLEKNIPLTAVIELTRRCPLSCRHCYLPEARGRARPGRELSARQWLKIFRELAGLGSMNLVLTGGEPLLRPDLPEIAGGAASLGFGVTVFTTGLPAAPALLRALKKAGVSSFELSLYGRPAVHDGITGLKGAQKRTLAAARLMKRLGFRVKLKCPLMRSNAGEAGYVMRTAKKGGFRYSFDIALAPGNDGDRAALKMKLSAAELKKSLRLPALRPEPNPEGGAGDLICGAGRNTVAFAPDGTVYPCLQLPLPLGNAVKIPLSRIWKNSGWLRWWRSRGRRHIEKCRSCRLWDNCSRCPGLALLEDGDLMGPSSQACRAAGLVK
ncbi:MAG: radical SAM protein [Elusimicrobia bacterium]|nr:MAG: radical SAM protein [Elusimicrobiota bacterium]KAF0157686.1 MAG: radical SAM protein [Elusimicrobiota bacterium]